MSVNEIDVNAVNERTRKEKEAEEQETEKVIALSKFLRGSLRWRLAYYLVRFIMVLEGIVWTIMDLLRAWRMRVSARINDNYQSNLYSDRDEEAAAMLKNGTETKYIPK